MSATQDHTQPPPLPESATERTARHLRTCRVLTDLALQLAEASAAVALRDLAQPPPPDFIPKPHASHPARLFTTLSAAVRQIITLERRIVSDDERRPAARPTYRAPNPRRPIVTRALQLATNDHPQSAALQEEMAVQLDRELTATPEATTADLITRICNGFGIHIPPDRGPGYPARFLYEALDSG